MCTCVYIYMYAYIHLHIYIYVCVSQIVFADADAAVTFVRYMYARSNVYSNRCMCACILKRICIWRR